MPVVAYAEGPSPAWTKAVDLSQSENFSFKPQIIADPAGGLHVFWLEYSLGRKGISVDSVYYRYGNGSTWSEPVDILYSSKGIFVSMAYIDPEWRLHLFWESGRKSYHSWVRYDRATSANNWRTEQMPFDGTPFGYLSPNGVLYVVIVSNNLGRLDYSRSEDYGYSWDKPTLVAYVGEKYISAMDGASIAVGGEGHIYIGWTLNTAVRNWSWDSVWLVYSTDGGVSWSNPRVVDKDPDPSSRDRPVHYAGGLTVLVDANGNPHLLWHRGASYAIGILHQWSQDGGQTWSDTEFYLPPKGGGVTGLDAWQVDSQGVLDVIVSANTDGKSNLFYVKWKDGRWSRREMIARSAEQPSAVLTNGNTLHLVWWSGNNVFYSRRDIDAPYAPPWPTPTARPAPTATPVLSTPTATLLSPTPKPTPVVKRRWSTPPDQTLPMRNDYAILLPGLIVAALLSSFVVLRVRRML